MASYIGGNPGIRRSELEEEVDLTKVGGQPITLGQKLGDSSIPVVFASDQELTVNAEGDFTTSSDHPEDAPHVTGDDGAFVLAIRNDNASNTLVSANGDYCGFAVDANGRLFVHDDQLLSEFGQTTDAESASGDGTLIALTKRLRTLMGNLNTEFDSSFTRIKEKRFQDTEEVRYDIPGTLANGQIYVGVAPDGTATSTASWDVVRTDFDANANPTRDRIQKGIAWDSRTTGW